MHRNIMLKCLNLFVILALLLPAIVPGATEVAHAQTVFDCSTTTGIATIDCLALVAIYNATGGAAWTNNTGWLQTTTPCSWYGVSCSGTERVVQLFLKGNGLTGALPEQLGDLDRLATLELQNNLLTSLPSRVGELTDLQNLFLYNNQLTSLPAQIGSLISLKELWLDGNHLTVLPAQIGNLTSLLNLRVGGNQLTSLPPEIGSLASLRWLDVNGGQLTTLPAQIGNLAALEELTLSNNQLTELPAEIGSLAVLNKLELDNNHLAALPAAFGSLGSLRELALWDNQLSAFPLPLTGLAALERLSVAKNQISALPPQISGMTGLIFLSLSENQLTALPSEIGSLASLIALEASGNALTTLPPAIGNLDALVTLYLNDNLLISLPAEIGSLPKLRTLDLEENLLATLPSQIGSLPSLTYLDLSHNQLSSLPPQIGDFPALTNLVLNGNQLTALPPEIGNLPELYDLLLHGNPLSGPIPVFLTNLDLLTFTFYDTLWCVPGYTAPWMYRMSTLYGTGLVCDQPLGNMTGVVTHPDGSAAAGINVQLYRSIYSKDEGPYRFLTVTQTASDGSFLIGLGQGMGIDYRVLFVDPDHRYAPQFYHGDAYIDSAEPITIDVGVVRDGVNAMMKLPKPPEISVSAPGSSITTNPVDGRVWINMPAPVSTAVTVTRQVTCPGGETPTSVSLLRYYPEIAYSMAPIGNQQYRGVVPAAHIVDGAELLVSSTCSGMENLALVGYIHLFNPTGTITDSITGLPVPGARVILHQIPGWLPKTDPLDTRGNTCQSTLSQPTTTPWTQPIPPGGGAFADPKVTPFSPEMAYQNTTAAGTFGWDLSSGCWYVRVQADGYKTMESTVMGGPDVANLNLALLPPGHFLYLPMLRRP